jgi:hypothetical protein
VVFLGVLTGVFVVLVWCLWVFWAIVVSEGVFVGAYWDFVVFPRCVFGFVLGCGDERWKKCESRGGFVFGGGGC